MLFLLLLRSVFLVLVVVIGVDVQFIKRLVPEEDGQDGGGKSSTRQRVGGPSSSPRDSFDFSVNNVANVVVVLASFSGEWLL